MRSPIMPRGSSLPYGRNYKVWSLAATDCAGARLYVVLIVWSADISLVGRGNRCSFVIFGVYCAASDAFNRSSATSVSNC